MIEFLDADGVRFAYMILMAGIDVFVAVQLYESIKVERNSRRKAYLWIGIAWCAVVWILIVWTSHFVMDGLLG